MRTSINRVLGNFAVIESVKDRGQNENPRGDFVWLQIEYK